MSTNGNHIGNIFMNFHSEVKAYLRHLYYQNYLSVGDILFSDTFYV